MKKVTRNKKVIAMMVVGLVAIFLATSGVIASPPMFGDDPPVASTINYQGQLTDSVGNPLTGTYDMRFQFWDSATGGSQVGDTITKNGVQVTNGLFSVKLDVDQADFNGQGLWLRMRVRPSGGTWDDWMTPRHEILPVPYALSLKPGAEINGEGTPGNAMLSVTNSGSGYGIYSEASNTGDVQNYGGYFVAEGRNGRGVYGKAANTGDAINYGGFFYASGVQGRGVFGQSAGSSGIGVKGWASDEGNVLNYGGHFTASGQRGVGVYGKAESAELTMVGKTYGGYFESASPTGMGAYAENLPTGNYAELGNWKWGVYGRRGDRDNYGALGTSSEGVLGYGEVMGGHFVATGEEGLGIRASAIDPNGYAADFVGNVRIRAGDLYVEDDVEYDGALVGAFPRPAYDSGWVQINPGQDKYLYHNLGGNVDNYVVDMQAKGDWGIHNFGYGSDFSDGDSHGACYEWLESDSIRICRAEDDMYCPFIRIRIWVYK